MPRNGALSRYGVPTGRTRSDGLAYALWLPDDPPTNELWPGVVIVHGAGSRKENHADFARLATAGGWAALTFDLPGHGDSERPMSGAAVEDVIGDGPPARFAGRRRPGSRRGQGIQPRRLPRHSRGRGLRGDRRGHRDLPGGPGPSRQRTASRAASRCESATRSRLEAWLLAQDIGDAVELIAPRPLILMHAEGDTQIPSDHSEELYERAGEPRKLIIVPGGAHTTVQHDPELQATALRWLERELAARGSSE